jgi:hypothetical protein
VDPLTIRYNNPGAVEYKPWMSRYGAVKGPDGRYAQFNSPDDGFGVMNRILDTYHSAHGLNTVSGIINRWAPSNVDNNSTAQYIDFVANRLGVSPDTALTAVQRPALMQAIALYEAGQPFPQSGASPPPAPNPAVPPAPDPPVPPQQQTIFPRSPMPTHDPDQPLVGLFRNTMENPLFLAGAGIFSAASQGKDIGSGILGSMPYIQQADKMAEERRRREAVNQMLNGPGLEKVNPTILNIARATQDPGIVVQDIQQALPNAQLQASIDQHKLTYPLEKQRLELQVDELKQKINDPIDQMLRERLKQNGAIATPSLPPQQGGLQPQSFTPGDGSEGMLIPAQASMPQPQAPAAPQVRAPQTEMVDLPGIGKVPVDTAKAIAFNYARKGNATAAKMIEEAIGSGLDKGARTELDKTRINLTNQLGRLQEIERTFKPDFQRVGNQLDAYFQAGAEKLGARISPDKQQFLQRFHEFRSSTLTHFNLMLKELSGTAVSAQEFERIKAMLPNAGTGFANGALDGDSPTVFSAKLALAKQAVKLAMARSNFMAAQGFRGDKEALASMMPLDFMPQIIERRGQMLEQGYRQQNPKADQRDIQRQVDQQLKQEFGI